MGKGWLNLSCAPAKTLVHKLSGADLRLSTTVVQNPVSKLHAPFSCVTSHIDDKTQAEIQRAATSLANELVAKCAEGSKERTTGCVIHASTAAGVGEGAAACSTSVNSTLSQGHEKPSSPACGSSLLKRLRHGLELADVSQGSTRVEDLVHCDADQFHLGGQEALAHLTELLALAPFETVLHIGCGIGGATRHVAMQQVGVQVIGLEGNHEHMEAARSINTWPQVAEQLQGRVQIQAMAALRELPDASIDKAFMMHAGMAVKEKVQLARQLCRVLKPGGRVVALETVAPGTVAVGQGRDLNHNFNKELVYPLPWADSPADSSVCHLRSYKVAYEVSGFTTVSAREVPMGPQREGTLAARLSLGLTASEKQRNYNHLVGSRRLVLGEMVFERPLRDMGTRLRSPPRRALDLHSPVEHRETSTASKARADPPCAVLPPAAAHSCHTCIGGVYAV